MRYIDRRFLLPVAAATTVWAQRPSPAAAVAEAALRARVEQFFQLQVDRKFRQAESLVAEDSKDAYYNGNKFNIKGFTIQNIELLDGSTRARVTIKAKVSLVLPSGISVDVEPPATSLWKIDDGQWTYYLDPTKGLDTPFGRIMPQKEGDPVPQAKVGKAPDIATLQNQVKVDRNAVVLTKDAPVQTVTLSNGLPGGAELSLNGDYLESFTVEIEKKHLESGESTPIRFSAKGSKPEVKVVPILVAPLALQVDIQVTKQ